MKCTNCGRNEAAYHFRANINGKITELHLCPDCAAAVGLGGAEDGEDDGGFFAELVDELFGGELSRQGGVFAVPVSVRRTEAERGEERPPRPMVDPELSRVRERNALREQMNEAAAAEDYETAARLRDELRKLEQGE